MQNVFLLCLALGAIVLVIQIIMDLVGGGLEGDVGSASAGDGLDLLSIRSLSAAAVLFGALGMWLTRSGMPLLITLPASLTAGGAGAVATAWLTRQMMRLESSGTLQLENAIGQSGTVYLPIPAHREGSGLVQFTLQGRTVELRAVADEEATLPTGTPVIVISVMENETVEVARTPLIEGIDA